MINFFKRKPARPLILRDLSPEASAVAVAAIKQTIARLGREIDQLDEDARKSFDRASNHEQQAKHSRELGHDFRGQAHEFRKQRDALETSLKASA